MINNKYSSIISKLLDATLQNRCSWQLTSQVNEYKVTIGKYIIVISQSTNGLFTIGRDHKEWYGITLYNEEGDIIDIQDISPDDECYKSMISLYIEARRSYYKVDSVLEEIEKEL